MNMSYCRFQNTVADLQDCVDDLENRGGLDGLNEYGEKLSRTEIQYALRLVEICHEIAEQFEDIDNVEELEKWESKIEQDI